MSRAAWFGAESVLDVGRCLGAGMSALVLPHSSLTIPGVKRPATRGDAGVPLEVRVHGSSTQLEQQAPELALEDALADEDSGFAEHDTPLGGVVRWPHPTAPGCIGSAKAFGECRADGVLTVVAAVATLARENVAETVRTDSVPVVPPPPPTSETRAGGWRDARCVAASRGRRTWARGRRRLARGCWGRRPFAAAGP